eukprot:CAMPEP_0197182382 /NCGR_PEP_ID=MMETSP1423-20130617/6350_1 /TAXON_ID=476441 /ORGANISM="Pseudo-nitzschia heimii, Strain UNC1101" /LENGTH=1613 /DNA_ID=CAMNT_0042632795 /DNA_START=137 /DNA_END=4978 /DNA_ORIENTATION=-
MDETASPENETAEGDAIVVNDVTALGINPTTPIASRAPIRDPSTQSTTPQASASLIREWDQTPDQPHLQLSRETSSTMPPLAPSVLWRDESNTSPAATVNAVAIVANIGRNFVRTVSETMMQRAPPSSVVTVQATMAATAADDSNNGHDRFNNHSVPPIPVVPSEAELSNANANNDGGNFMADLEDEHQISYVVDGQIYTLYDSASTRDMSRDDPNSSQRSDRQISKSSRMQRFRRLKKLRKIFAGSRNAKGESGRRKRRDSRDSDPSESTEVGSGERSRLLGAPKLHPRGDTVSDGDYESGDGESIIEAPYSHHPSSLTATQSDRTNMHGSRNFPSQNRSACFSEEFRNLSINSSSTNQSQKKRTGLVRWLRGTTSESSSSNRSMGNQSPGSITRNKNRKSPPSSSKKLNSSIQKHSRNIRGIDSNSNSGRKGLSSKPSTMNGKPPALDPRHLSNAFMPPLRENSFESTRNSLSHPSQPSLLANSTFHAQPTLNSHMSGQGLFASSDGQNEFAARASLVDNADITNSESGHLPIEAYYVDDRFDEYDKDGSSKKKHDKQEDPCIDNLLQRAGEIAEMAKGIQEEDISLKLPPSPTRLAIKKGKSDGESVPLSIATPDDQVVHNDYLKLILVGDNAVDKSGLGRSLRKLTKKKGKKNRKPMKMEVHNHDWTPSDAGVNFRMWEVIAAKSEDKYLPNFGARPGTQSLFFSDQSLYLLAYDLGASNPATIRHCDKSHETDSDDDSSIDEWDRSYNVYLREEANRKADRALQADIKERVLSWVNCIARAVTRSAILPIALKPPNMSRDEAMRRCNIMQTLILNYDEKKTSNDARPKILRGTENVVCVSLDDNTGMQELEQMILEIADSSHNVFGHVGSRVPPGTVEIIKICEQLRKEEKYLVPVEHLIAKLPERPEFSTEAVMGVLCFLASIGEVVYFGCSDCLLKDYVILNHQWLVAALYSFLKNNLHQELSDTRFWMLNNGGHYFPESNVTKTFSGNNSSCPILSSQDAQMLWQMDDFWREAVQKSSHLSDELTTKSTMFDFLQHLLEKRNVFLPLDMSLYHSTEKIFFVPSLLPKASSSDVWTYKNSDSWKVTLCHSWLFRDGAPAGVMEQVTVALLRDLYESSHKDAGSPIRNLNSSLSDHHLQQTNSLSVGQSHVRNSIESHGIEPVGPIEIDQINCWQNSLLLRICRSFRRENEANFTKKLEIFVTITDLVSPHSVASDAMRSNMQRLVVSGKGDGGSHGQWLWKAGYNIVLDSIKASVANCTNVEREVVCPECLSTREASKASTLSWDYILASRDLHVRCNVCHQVDRHLLCGTIPMITRPADLGETGNIDIKPVRDILPSIVLIGLWNKETKTIDGVGSGFIVHKNLGLVVSASHTLFNMKEGNEFGQRYKGLRNACAIIGVIPNRGENDTNAVFRYFAEIVAADVHNMDACILKITSRLENDVCDHCLIGEQPDRVIENIQEESLPRLKLTTRFEIEQRVRIIGFNQGGEGILEPGEHVNRTSDFACGYICKHFKPEYDDSSTSSDDSSTSPNEEGRFSPREEIVVNCFTIAGHSGGPCVNNDGKVVGILCRADNDGGNRCYLVPSSEIKKLIGKVKKTVDMVHRGL